MVDRRSLHIALVIAALSAAALAALGWWWAQDDVDRRFPGFGGGEAVRFLVLGDTGTGEEGQRLVANASRLVCEARGCDLVLLTGDNFYPDGVKSVNDPLWNTTFEEMYVGFHVPFYASLGNHDYGVWEEADDLLHERAEAQVHYTTVDDDAPLWRMPGRYYDFSLGPARFFALDTTPIHVRENGTEADNITVAQEQWLGEELDDADAPWRFAFGHHPYVSNGDHGNSSASLLTFMEDHLCDDVHVYFSGHDHTLAWLAPVSQCGATSFVVSGAAAEPREIEDPERNEAWFQQGDTLGFWWFEVDRDELRGVAYDGEGRVLYERSVTR